MQLPILFIREKINGVWEFHGDRDRFFLEDGHFEVDLNLQGEQLRIYFEKGTSTDNGTMSTCYIDNLIITQNSLEIVEENNYYPFGLKHKGYSNVVNGTDHLYGFGGKEEQGELELGWIDITARNYNPALGRWMNIDPLAERMRRHSPYNYAFNNPVYWLDPDGRMPISPMAMNMAINTVKDLVNHDFDQNFDNGVLLDEVVVAAQVDPNDIKFRNGDIGKEHSNYTILYCETCVSEGQQLDLPMNLRQDSFKRYLDEFQLNLLGFYYNDGIRVNSSGKALHSRGLVLGGSGAMGLIGGRFNPEQLIAAARVISKAGFNKVGRAFQKHGSRAGSNFPKPSGSPATMNAEGEKILSEILANPSSTSTTRHHARFGEILEVKAPNGQGARFSADGKEFIGFIEN